VIYTPHSATFGTVQKPRGVISISEATILKISLRHISSLLFWLLAITATAVLSSSTLLAQQTLGGITGEVTDSSGGVLPSVKVTVVDEQTALTRS
jgi:hypothetical protein